MGGDPPATIQSLYEISSKSYRACHLQPLSVHRVEYRLFTVLASQRRQETSSKQIGIANSCMLLVARGSAWPELWQRSSLPQYRLRQPIELIEAPWQYCWRCWADRSGPQNFAGEKNIICKYPPILWPRFTSTLLVVLSHKTFLKCSHRSSRIHRQRLEVRGAAG